MIKLIGLVAVASILVACNSGPTHSNREMSARIEGLELCPQERPQVCTMEYRPTCGHLDNGRRKDYASHCSACSDKEVVGTFEGSCDSQ
jgi:hypothetical protein